MEDNRVTWIERYQRSTALVKDACVGVGRVVIEVHRAAGVRAGEDLEPAVHLVRAIEGDHQIRSAVFRDRVTLLPGDECHVLVPGKASANAGRLQVDLIDDPARRGHADRFHELQDPPVVAEESHRLAGRRRKRYLSQRARSDRSLPSAAAPSLYLVAGTVDLGIRSEMRTLSRQIIGRPAKRFDLSWCK